MPKATNKTTLRILVGVGVPLALISLAFICLALGNTPPCLFYELTGLYCVGCGAGRAFISLLHGKIYAAFRFQPLMMLMLPIIAYYCLKQYIAFVFGRDILPFPTIRSRFVGIFVLVVIVAYWILRNIPVFPFNLLAPTSVY